jgi:hypothetical protein
MLAVFRSYSGWKYEGVRYGPNADGASNGLRSSSILLTKLLGWLSDELRLSVATPPRHEIGDRSGLGRAGGSVIRPSSRTRSRNRSRLQVGV